MRDFKMMIQPFLGSMKQWLLKKPPSVQQWFWFGILWIFGLCVAFIATYPFKILIRIIKAYS